MHPGLEASHAIGPGNVLVIGEALGTTLPFTGEGIGKAMESGEIAASVAHKALSANDYTLLHEYLVRVETELKPRYRGYERAQRAFSESWLAEFMCRQARNSKFLLTAIHDILEENLDPYEVFSIEGMLKSLWA